MLVGDLIQKIRLAVTDLPGTIPNPTATFAVVSAAGSTFPAGTYYSKVTQRNQWGETLPTAESAALVVGANQGIQITSQLLPGATTIRAYLTLAGGGSASECQFVESSSSPFTIAANPASAGNVPVLSSAYNPDTDGDSFSCASVYEWIDVALKVASQICGGLVDYCGVQSQAGNPTYIVPGQWKQISDVWYDGYPLSGDKVGNFFRRNSITASVLSSVATSIFDNRMAIEVWPQPARTGASTTLNGNISATASSFVAANAGGFLLTNGMVMVDNEIMAYAGLNGNNFPGLIRGLGGSSAQAHISDAPVVELNLFFHGWRMYNPTYQPGQSTLTIPIPVGWDSMMLLYGLARARLAEQNTQEYSALYGQFKQEMTQWWRTNKIFTGQRQLGDSNSLEVIPGSTGISWVLP